MNGARILVPFQKDKIRECILQLPEGELTEKDVGLTPGLTQMKLAFQSARAALWAGKSFEEANQASIESARFEGTMRKNLIRMLNQIEFDKHLGLEEKTTLVIIRIFLNCRH